MPGLEIRVFDKAVNYCVDRGAIVVDNLFFWRMPFLAQADSRTSKDPNFQSGRDGSEENICSILFATTQGLHHGVLLFR